MRLAELEMLLRPVQPARLAPFRAPRQLALLVANGRAVRGLALERHVGDFGQRILQRLGRPPSPPPRPALMASLRLATSAISACARASSFAALAWPISLEAALRRVCASCAFCTAARRAASSAISASRGRRRPALPQRLVERLRILANPLDVQHVPLRQ